MMFEKKCNCDTSIWIRVRIPNTDPDPETQIIRISIRFRNPALKEPLKNRQNVANVNAFQCQICHRTCQIHHTLFKYVLQLFTDRGSFHHTNYKKWQTRRSMFRGLSWPSRQKGTYYFPVFRIRPVPVFFWPSNSESFPF
jgi:hypothetical protein